MTGATPPESWTPAEPEDVCDYAGHEWLPAGGGMLVCGTCQAEKWDDGSEASS